MRGFFNNIEAYTNYYKGKGSTLITKRSAEGSNLSHESLVKMREISKMTNSAGKLPESSNMMDMVANGTAALLESYRKLND